MSSTGSKNEPKAVRDLRIRVHRRVFLVCVCIAAAVFALMPWDVPREHYGTIWRSITTPKPICYFCARPADYTAAYAVTRNGQDEGTREMGLCKRCRSAGRKLPEETDAIRDMMPIFGAILLWPFLVMLCAIPFGKLFAHVAVQRWHARQAIGDHDTDLWSPTGPQ